MARVTPARKQYLDIKAQYPDCILLFRLGDFYEMFDSDAEIAARELDIALTQRTYGHNAAKVPMAGIPYHAVDNYLPKLLEKGYHVAICDQIGEVPQKGIVQREVTRVLTPGTAVEPTIIPEDRHNYLMALFPFGNPKSGEWHHAGIAYVDASTGEFAATQFHQDDNVGVSVLEEIARLKPSEIIVPKAWHERGMTVPNDAHLSPIEDWRFEGSNAEQSLLNHFNTQSLHGFGLHDKPFAACAAGAIVSYLKETHMSSLSQITQLRYYSTADFMVLDPFTRRNLEITETIRGRDNKGSLLHIIDHTTTPMGKRLLRSWLNKPLLDRKRIQARLNAVEALTDDGQLRAEIFETLRNVSDIERLANRIAIGHAHARDLLALHQSLAVVPHIHEHIQSVDALSPLRGQLLPCEDAQAIIQQAITDNPPSTLNTLGTIRSGYDEELDTTMQRSAHARDWIAGLEKVERQNTRIDKLKVGYNKVFGYYIEVPKTQTAKVPEHYIRKQTLVNAERYITPEMKEYETIVLNAEEEILAIERRIFHAVCQRIHTYQDELLKTARAIANLDVLLSLADVAVQNAYVKPTITEDNTLDIKSGRHPVVEQMLDGQTRYIANDTRFSEQDRIHIITGPNMSGKSTYIRQVAVIMLMAQIGSFVPADEATIGLTDRIFARIGAQDEIHAGQSTFMVEMVETARLLSGSSSRSLLILDEVGRGTSTYDGLAIARAVIEYIHNSTRLNCRTLFATHYHELTELPNILPRSTNYNVSVSERGDDIVFLHKVVSGGADRSYGVHVAQLAGMPRPVVERARELLEHLESTSNNFERKPKQKAQPADTSAQLSFFSEPAENPAIEMIRRLEIENLSPIEALNKLYELKRAADSES